jgi:hypothetical protein
MKLLSRVPLDNRRRGSYLGFRADPRADIPGLLTVKTGIDLA